MDGSDSMVSIIVPCYNHAHYLEEALNSVLQQSYTNWECIIINDGSTDNTKSVGEAYVNKDPRFKLINIQNSGVSVAKNTAIAEAKGTYIFPLDADNKMHPECLGLCISEFEKKPTTCLVYTEAELFGEETGLWNLDPFDYKSMLKYNMIDNSAMFLKKDFLRVGGYRTNMVQGLEDWDFFIALLYGVGKQQVIKINRPLYSYRVSNSGRRMTVAYSGGQTDMLDCMVYNNFFIYKEYFPEIFTRIHEYEFLKTMMAKPPIKWLSRWMIRLSSLKKRFISP
jgi:glycosyltransferase involved in cell wall biosynthesis